MENRIRHILREQYGEFDTYLELVYEKQLLENVSTKHRKRVRAWLTYNQVILELKHNIKDSLKLRELQYRLTDNENPNKACLEVLTELKETHPEIERLYYKIMNF
jgi:hypothetical protein